MGAFAEAMSVEMEGLSKDLKNDLSRQCWGTGDGRLAQAGADTVTGTESAISVYNRYAEPGQPGARFIEAGMLLDAGTVASPRAHFSGVSCIAVSISSNPATTTDTVTVSSTAITVSQCDTFLFNADAGGAGLELLGMQALVDEYTASNHWGSNAFYGSSIMNLNRGSVSRFNSIVIGNSGVERVIDSNLMQLALDQIHIASGYDADWIGGEHSVVRALLDSVSADRRYVASGAPSYDMGNSGLSYNGIKIVRDRFAPYNSLLVMKKACIKQFTLLDTEFADDDGSVLSRVSNQDAFEAFVRTYRNIGFDMAPKGCAFIRDIRVDL
jgi:hypothetical protein